MSSAGFVKAWRPAARLFAGRGNPGRVHMRSAALCVTAVLSMSAMAQEYDPAAVLNWKAQSFEGQTDYTLITAEKADAGHAAIRAHCHRATASGLGLERSHELAESPVLEWQWRVDEIYSGLDERDKAGDDYPARVYVVAQRWPAFRSRAINYVWASSLPQGESWENAFAGQFIMLAVRSGPEQLGQWVTERRNVLEDFRQLHGFEPDRIDVLAIMTDCDNAGQSTTAWYGPIRWLAD